MSSDRYLCYDPWANKWVSWLEYEAAIEERIRLSYTRRYRLARFLDRLRGKPVRPDTRYLRHKLIAVDCALASDCEGVA